jgi:hypothetical protein
VLLDRFELLKDRFQLIGLVDLPVFLGAKANPRAVGATAFVGAAVSRGRGPRRRNKFRNGDARGEDRGLERGDIGSVDERVRARGPTASPSTPTSSPSAPTT